MLLIKIDTTQQIGQKSSGTANVYMCGDGRDILVEAGAAVDTMVVKIIETAYEANKMAGEAKKNELAGEGVEALAELMQIGFKEAIKELKEKSILNAGYGEEHHNENI